MAAILDTIFTISNMFLKKVILLNQTCVYFILIDCIISPLNIDKKSN